MNATIVILFWMLAMSPANSIQVCHSQSQPNNKPGLVVEGVLPPIVIGRSHKLGHQIRADISYGVTLHTGYGSWIYFNKNRFHSLTWLYVRITSSEAQKVSCCFCCILELALPNEVIK